MGSCHIISTMYALLVAFSLQSNCHAGLYNHSEIRKANDLIDSLYTKLHTKLQVYQTKYESLQQESKAYLERSDTTQDEIKMLKRLKGLLNDLTRKSSMCEKFYMHFDFTVAREIMINSNASLQKDHTLAVEGIACFVLIETVLFICSRPCLQKESLACLTMFFQLWHFNQ